MKNQEIIYKDYCIVIYMHSLPNKQYMAEISIDGTAYPITRVSDLCEDFIFNSAFASAKKIIDSKAV
jgi:hypothetical protein